jgi:hypothetical protein
MTAADEPQQAFQISIGGVTFHPNSLYKFVQKLQINGVEFEADPRQFIKFFERLLEEIPGDTEGCPMDVSEEFVKDLVKARVAVSEGSGRIWPTMEFRAASYDFLTFLKQSKFPVPVQGRPL